MKKRDLGELVEEVMDLVDRGEINSAEEALREFENVEGVNLDEVKKCLEEEFEEGYSDNWEKIDS